MVLHGHLLLSIYIASLFQLLEAETVRHVFLENRQLCENVEDRIIQHIVHCIESHGRYVQYLKLLLTFVHSDGRSLRKVQQSVMVEVSPRLQFPYPSRRHWIVTYQFSLDTRGSLECC